jgi:hypothetical protein
MNQDARSHEIKILGQVRKAVAKSGYYLSVLLFGHMEHRDYRQYGFLGEILCLRSLVKSAQVKHLSPLEQYHIYLIIIIIIIFRQGFGRLTSSSIDALPSFPGASTISSSSSRFVVWGRVSEFWCCPFFQDG